jgi:hypothetical protein
MPTVSVKPTSAGMSGMLEAPIAEETSTAVGKATTVGKAATADNLAIAGNQQQNQKQQQEAYINCRPNISVRDSWNRWNKWKKPVAVGFLTTVGHW